MKNRSDTEMIQVFGKIYTNLISRGITPILIIMDNEASSTVTTWLTAHDAGHQKVAPYNHHANWAERTIETAKHHLLSTLASTDRTFPINQWDWLVSQGQHTLNMLRPCHINPNISAYMYLERSP